MGTYRYRSSFVSRCSSGLLWLASACSPPTGTQADDAPPMLGAASTLGTRDEAAGAGSVAEAASSSSSVSGDQQALRLAPLPLDALPELSIVDYENDGVLCPKGADNGLDEWSVAEGAYQYQFNFVVEGPVEAQGTCVMSVQLRIPAGWKFRKPLVQYYAHASYDATVSTRTTIDKASGAATPGQEVLGGTASAIWRDADPQNDWSQTCDDLTSDSILRIDHIVDANMATGENGTNFGLILDANFGYDAGTEWARCGEDTPVVAPPGDEGVACVLHPSRPCADEWTCELMDGLELNRGICVDAMERLPPQPVGEICNGVREIACDGDSVCWFETAENKDMGVTGVCRPQLAAALERCDGYPEIPCAPDTKCSQFEAIKRCEPQR